MIAHYHNAGQILFLMDGGVSAVMEHHRLVPPSLGRMDNRLKILGTEGQVEITHDGRVWLYLWDEQEELTDLPTQQDIFANFVRTACAGHRPNREHAGCGTEHAGHALCHRSGV